MARRQRGTPVHGWVVLDKPEGLTSTQAVGRVRRLFDAQKAGHGGTLDPMASGILPIALGEATKTVPQVMDGRKSYRFSVRFGQATDTDDREGTVIATSPVCPQAADIAAALGDFAGRIEQVPPKYSAIKIDGARAYDLARSGADVAMVARMVEAHRLALLGMPAADVAEIEIDCGKGFYVRALARDLARALGTFGHLIALRRTACGSFCEADAISLSQLETLGHSARSSAHLLPVETALDDIPALALTAVEAHRLSQGQEVPALPVLKRSSVRSIQPGGTVAALDGGRLVALACVDGGALRPVRVLNLPSDNRAMKE